ncbi:hypothetical protein L1S34_12280 [Flavobacterium sp. K77]|uniref:hypothetical protein n=1 Tax=Flavobacterium sp. K77 TaxID=2910676 RepID=UPI001F3B0DBF|nr:hypothetical protein [Flavobacterium sp. K77]MCF6142066.1 hypothetical protein [Flavobacterium sp. K77]
MLKIYYRIWVSLFLNIKTAQNGNQNAALILSFLVLTAINFMNILLISLLLILFFEIRIETDRILPMNPTIRNWSILLLFLIPNYFLIGYNKHYEILLDKYEKQNIKNLGRNYFFISFILILILIFSTIAFPEFFNLTAKK